MIIYLYVERLTQRLVVSQFGLAAPLGWNISCFVDDNPVLGSRSGLAVMIKATKVVIPIRAVHFAPIVRLRTQYTDWEDSGIKL